MPVVWGINSCTVHWGWC